MVVSFQLAPGHTLLRFSTICLNCPPHSAFLQLQLRCCPYWKREHAQSPLCHVGRSESAQAVILGDTGNKYHNIAIYLCPASLLPKYILSSLSRAGIIGRGYSERLIAYYSLRCLGKKARYGTPFLVLH